MKKILVVVAAITLLSCSKENSCKEYTSEWVGGEKIVTSITPTDATEESYLYYDALVSNQGDTTFVHHYVECN